jgi:hypothetical protein
VQKKRLFTDYVISKSIVNIPEDKNKDLRGYPQSLAAAAVGRSALSFSPDVGTIRAMKRFGLLMAAALAIALPGAAASNTNLYIRVNQVGYRPGDTKVAMAFSTNPIGPAFSLYAAGPACADAKATDHRAD